MIGFLNLQVHICTATLIRVMLQGATSLKVTKTIWKTLAPEIRECVHPVPIANVGHHSCSYGSKSCLDLNFSIRCLDSQYFSPSTFGRCLGILGQGRCYYIMSHHFTNSPRLHASECFQSKTDCLVTPVSVLIWQFCVSQPASSSPTSPKLHFQQPATSPAWPNRPELVT